MLSRDLEKNRLAMTPPMLNLKAGIESFLMPAAVMAAKGGRDAANWAPTGPWIGHP